MNRIGFSFDKQKALAGMVMAVLVLLICGAFYSWKAGIFFSVLYFLGGCISFRISKHGWQIALNIILGVTGIVLTFFASRVIDNVNPVFVLGTDKKLLNILCVAIVCGIVFLLTARWRVSFVIGTFLMMFLTTANNIVYDFRGRELVFTDLFAVKTAMNVADQYVLTVPETMAYGWFLWGIIVITQFMISCPKPRSPIKSRVAAAVSVAALTLILHLASADMPLMLWYDEGTLVNGIYLNFYISARQGVAEKPNGYSEDAISSLESRYAEETDGDIPEKLPNIIVIMNESYADLSVIGGELKTSQPVTPVWDSLKENTIKGYTLTSVFGGTTPNSEFEFLTSHSMGNLPKGSVPYQQYMNEEAYSLAWLLQSYGYECLGTHPFLENSWSRKSVYPKLGFTATSFQESYPMEDILRTYVTDREMYNYAFQKMQETDSDTPFFFFGVTMQNHGGYKYQGDDYTQTIWLEGYENEYPQAEQYLSLIHESDDAMGELLTNLEEYPEDTVVLFFGDHLPQLDTGFYEELHGGTFETLDEQSLQYTVPFFIWANYDISEYHMERTSLNYLAVHLLKAANLPLTPYYQFLEEMEEVIPAMNLFGYYGAEATTMAGYDEAMGEESVWLKDYAMLQYNNLLDTENRSRIFYKGYFDCK